MRNYLRLCTVNKAGLVVHMKAVPFQSKQAELIVIPRSHTYTFPKALNVPLNHPVPTQFALQFTSQYMILDQKKILQAVYDSCDVPCQATRLLPKETMTYNTETKPTSPGTYLNADVMVEAGQKILLVKDNLTSFSQSAIIKNEQKETPKEALFNLTSNLCLKPAAVIRVDSHSSLKFLQTDRSLEKLRFVLQIRNPKNVN